MHAHVYRSWWCTYERQKTFCVSPSLLTTMRVLEIQLSSSMSGAGSGFTIEPSHLSIFDITRYSKCKSVIWKIIWLIQLGQCWELDLACGPKFYFIWRDDDKRRYFLGSHSLVDLFWLWLPCKSPGDVAYGSVAKLLEFLLRTQAFSGIFWFVLCWCSLELRLTC